MTHHTFVQTIPQGLGLPLPSTTPRVVHHLIPPRLTNPKPSPTCSYQLPGDSISDSDLWSPSFFKVWNLNAIPISFMNWLCRPGVKGFVLRFSSSSNLKFREWITSWGWVCTRRNRKRKLTTRAGVEKKPYSFRLSSSWEDILLQRLDSVIYTYFLEQYGDSAARGRGHQCW